VTTGGILLIVGSVVFGIGAAVGVPGALTQRDPQVRLRMLTERLRAWQVAQPLYGAGPVMRFFYAS
jgi:type II secretory pathway pseudopilin PulG